MPKTILIIEDEPEIRTVLAMAVEMDGEFVAVSADNGEDGLLIAEAKRPDVILMDVLMPGMDGYEVCRRIKANPRLKDIPVVFLSAQADYKEQENTREAGGCASLNKPFDPLQISAMIKKAMKEAGAA